MDVIREYAKRKGLEIVKEYSDEGKSGLNIEGRDSLAQMIQDVQGGQAGFSNILVYDVSRCIIVPSNLKTTAVRYQRLSLCLCRGCGCSTIIQFQRMKFGCFP